MENSKRLSFRDHFLPEILSHWDFTVKVWLQPDTGFVLKTISCAAWLRNLDTTHWASLWREMCHFNEPPQGGESRTLPNGDSVLCFVLKIAHGTLAIINVSAITVITVWSLKNGKASLGESKTHVSLKHSLLCTQEREQPCWLGVRAPLAGSRRGFFASSSLPLAVPFTKHSLGEKGASLHQPGESESESHVWLFVTPWTVQCMEFFRPEYWNGELFPSPGDLPNPGIEPRSPALQADSLPAEPQGKPKNTTWAAYPFSSRSSWPRNWIGVSCIAGRF